ncbi:MAG: lyase family protein [Patescibacteria group bacterium]
MISRYANKEIESIFSDSHKLELWQKTELAVIEAMVKLEKVNRDQYLVISNTLNNTPIDIEWWKNKDEEIHHDLNAFIDERVRHLEKELHQYFHKNITSYDTEEPAFARSLSEAIEVIRPLGELLEKNLTYLAIRYRYTVMNARTHGQEAEMQTFGARVLTWLADYLVAKKALEKSSENLYYSKLSGAIGKYGSLDPKTEEEALRILGFFPFYGSTQIMPRILYAPIAQSLCNIVLVINKIGVDIRLASRSGRPLLQEPFKKKQKGSSAMPHKKNTIRTEQLEGMARMAKGYMNMITDNIGTWEERAIEQSCVERVAWPDLFHVLAQSFKVINMVLNGLTVYPENMLKEIHESRGVYASSEAKEFLKENGLGHEDAYRIVQLACFNVFESEDEKPSIIKSFDDSLSAMYAISRKEPGEIVSIREFIPRAALRVSETLDINQEEVDGYNKALKEIFSKFSVRENWSRLFTPAFLLKNEAFLYQKILGE